MRKMLYYRSKFFGLSIFWFTCAFHDAHQKFSPSVRGQPEILFQNKTIITNMLG